MGFVTIRFVMINADGLGESQIGAWNLLSGIRNYGSRLIIEATYPAPKPLSIFTTLTFEAQDIPSSFPLREASTVLDYDFVKIGDRTYLLPLRAEVRMRSEHYLTRNDVEFRQYRKYSADSSITFDTPEPISEDQTKEQPVK